MKALVVLLARALVKDEAQVSVVEETRDDSTVLRLSVGKDDAGRIIGKHGRTVEALRTVVAAIASEAGRSVALELVE
ncbi:MAG: KH domain-containing protein [Acidobacteriota bacterium]